jgi:predicted  nucleic acid-binding Zn-ribbon protein
MSDSKSENNHSDRLQQITEDLERISELMDRRFQGLESGLEGLDRRMDNIDERIAGLLQVSEKSLEGLRALTATVSKIEKDLKQFASIANETALHYSDEIQNLRQRLDALEP